MSLKLQLPANDQRITVIGVGLQDPIIQLACIVVALTEKEQANIVFRNGYIFRMLLAEEGVFGRGLAYVASQEIEITQQAIAG